MSISFHKVPFYQVLTKYYCIVLEKEMATHSSVLAWSIPGTGEPGRRPSMGSYRTSTRLK